MSFSQHNEEEVINLYFKDYIGTLLSIGENNGEHLSNVRALIEKNWQAVLVEPAPEPFKDLCGLYLHRDDVTCLNFAISDYNGNSKFFDSGTHLNVGDTSLLSSLMESEIQKWKPSTKFKEIEVKVIKFETLLAVSPYKKFDFISTDAEGNDIVILKQMNLGELGCKCICIEWNSHPEILKEITEYCAQFGLTKQLLKNAENIILAHE